MHTNLKYTAINDCIMFVSGSLKRHCEICLFYVCPCFCSRMTMVILSWTLQSSSNSSSTMNRLLSCSLMQIRRATSCSGWCVCLWVYMLRWVCSRAGWKGNSYCLRCFFVSISFPLNYVNVFICSNACTYRPISMCCGAILSYAVSGPI